MERIAPAVALLTWLILWADGVVSGPGSTEEVPSTHVPHILSTSETVTVRSGQRVVFECRVDELGGFAKVWKKDEELYFTNDYRFVDNGRISLTADSSLQISQVTASDSGEYVCQISTDQPQELRHRLVVVVAPTVTTVPSDGRLAVGVGQNFSIGCQATGLPQLSLTWTHSEGISMENIREGNYIVVPAAEEKHAGEYKCTVSNGYDDPVTGSIRVFIHSVEDADRKQPTDSQEESAVSTGHPAQYGESEASPAPEGSQEEGESAAAHPGATLLLWALAAGHWRLFL